MALAYGNTSLAYRRVRNGISDLLYEVNANYTLRSAAAPYADASALPTPPPGFKPFFAPLVHVRSHPPAHLPPLAHCASLLAGAVLLRQSGCLMLPKRR